MSQEPWLKKASQHDDIWIETVIRLLSWSHASVFWQRVTAAGSWKAAAMEGCLRCHVTHQFQSWPCLELMASYECNLATQVRLPLLFLTALLLRYTHRLRLDSKFCTAPNAKLAKHDYVEARGALGTQARHLR